MATQVNKPYLRRKVKFVLDKLSGYSLKRDRLNFGTALGFISPAAASLLWYDFNVCKRHPVNETEEEIAAEAQRKEGHEMAKKNEESGEACGNQLDLSPPGETSGPPGGDGKPKKKHSPHDKEVVAAVRYLNEAGLEWAGLHLIRLRLNYRITHVKLWGLVGRGLLLKNLATDSYKVNPDPPVKP
jgi:hypothetical protein